MSQPKKTKRHPTLPELICGGDLIRPDELAKALKVAQGTVYMWVERGVIPFMQLEKCVRFDPGEIRDWLKAKQEGAVEARTKQREARKNKKDAETKQNNQTDLPGGGTAIVPS